MKKADFGNAFIAVFLIMLIISISISGCYPVFLKEVRADSFICSDRCYQVRDGSRIYADPSSILVLTKVFGKENYDVYVQNKKMTFLSEQTDSKAYYGYITSSTNPFRLNIKVLQSGQTLNKDYYSVTLLKPNLTVRPSSPIFPKKGGILTISFPQELSMEYLDHYVLNVQTTDHSSQLIISKDDNSVSIKNLLGNMKYTVWLEAVFRPVEGKTSFIKSASATFYTENSTPSIALISPGENEYVPTGEHMFKFEITDEDVESNRVNNNVSYYIYIRKGDSVVKKMEGEVDFNGAESLTVEKQVNLDQEGDYSWEVVVRDRSASGEYIEVRKGGMFKVFYSPVPEYPENGEVINITSDSTSVVFKWDFDASTPVIFDLDGNEEEINGNSVVKTLSRGIHNWRVGVLVDGEVRWCSPQPLQFVINGIPHVLQLLSPVGENNVDLTPEFKWNAYDPDSDQTLRYTINLRLYGLNETLLKVTTDSTDFVFNVPLIPHTEYEWWVEVSDGYATTTSQMATFTTLDHLPAIHLIYPVSLKDIAYSIIKFMWDASDIDNDSLKFTLEIFGDNDVIYKQTTDSTEVTIETGESIFSAHTKYGWQVLVTDGYATVTSEYATFVTLNHSPEWIKQLVFNLLENTTFSTDLSIYAWDPDGDALGFFSNDASLEIDGTKLTVSFGYFDSGIKTFTITATDNYGGESSTDITFNIGNVNRPPVFEEIPEVTVDLGTPVSINLSDYAHDPDGDPITFQLVSGPEGMEIKTTDSGTLLVWTPTLSISSEENFTYTVKVEDSEGSSTEQTSTITVINTPPLITLIYPASNQENVATDCTFTWEATDINMTDSIATVILYLSSSEEDVENMVETAIATIGQNIKSYSTELNSAATYYWRVLAYDSNNASSTSEVWNFRTLNGAPTTPRITMPASGDGNVWIYPEIRWTPSTDPENESTNYSISIFKINDDDSKTLIASDATDSTMYVLPYSSPLDVGSTYEVVIKAQDSSGNYSSPASAVFETIANVKALKSGQVTAVTISKAISNGSLYAAVEYMGESDTYTDIYQFDSDYNIQAQKTVEYSKLSISQEDTNYSLTYNPSGIELGEMVVTIGDSGYDCVNIAYNNLEASDAGGNTYIMPMYMKVQYSSSGFGSPYTTPVYVKRKDGSLYSSSEAYSITVSPDQYNYHIGGDAADDRFYAKLTGSYIEASLHSISSDNKDTTWAAFEGEVGSDFYWFYGGSEDNNAFVGKVNTSADSDVASGVLMFDGSSVGGQVIAMTGGDNVYIYMLIHDDTSGNNSIGVLAKNFSSSGGEVDLGALVNIDSTVALYGVDLYDVYDVTVEGTGLHVLGGDKDGYLVLMVYDITLPLAPVIRWVRVFPYVHAAYYNAATKPKIVIDSTNNEAVISALVYDSKSNIEAKLIFVDVQ